MRPSVALALLATSLAAPLPGQNARDQIRNLFAFGDCGEFICISTGAGTHGNHFKPDADASGREMIDFLSGAIGVSVSNIPLAAASSGTIFGFDPTGAPTVTMGSSGPIFGERAQTLGRGRFLFGVNVTGSRFEKIRGVDMSDINLTLTHEDSDFPIPGLGSPSFELDTVHVAADMGISIAAFTAIASYGINNRIDVGVAVPVVHMSFDGTARGTIVNVSGQPLHFFTPTAGNPQPTTATSTRSASKTGLGDVAVRLKFNVAQTPRAGAAVLADLRLPTGDERNLLGTGEFSARGLGIVSARYGQLSPHANVGFLYRAGGKENSALLGTVGADALVGTRATLAADLLGQIQVGDSKLMLPPPAEYIDGSVVRRTTIPDKKDNLLDGSLGLRINAGRDMNVLANVLIPLTDGGVRPSVLWTVGAQRVF